MSTNGRYEYRLDENMRNILSRGSVTRNDSVGVLPKGSTVTVSPVRVPTQNVSLFYICRDE